MFIVLQMIYDQEQRFSPDQSLRYAEMLLCAGASPNLVMSGTDRGSGEPLLVYCLVNGCLDLAKLVMKFYPDVNMGVDQEWINTSECLCPIMAAMNYGRKLVERRLSDNVKAELLEFIRLVFITVYNEAVGFQGIYTNTI